MRRTVCVGTNLELPSTGSLHLVNDMDLALEEVNVTNPECRSFAKMKAAEGLGCNGSPVSL